MRLVYCHFHCNAQKDLFWLRDDESDAGSISPPASIVEDSDSDDEYGEFEERKGKTTIQALKEKVEEPKVWIPTTAEINDG
jgi:hypothetical protein